MKFNFDKRSLLGAFTLSGAMIGAGILGLPYVFSRAGFLVGLFWVILIGIVLLFVHLYMGEVMLRSRGEHQLPGYAQKYLGVFGKRIMLFAMFFGIYSALVAYLIGEGQSLSYFFMGDLKYSIVFAFLFWLLMTFLLGKGLKQLKKVESWIVPAIVLIIIGLFIYLMPQVKPANITSINYGLFFMPLGVVLFSLLGFSSIPEVGKIMKGKEKKLKFALIFGSILPMVLYALFGFAFVGAFGITVKQVATLSMGRYASLLGVLTMITSYFVLSFAMKDVYEEDLKMSKKKTYFLVSFLPIILYLIVSLTDIIDFVKILGIGGVISGGVTGVLILLMNFRAKKYGDRTPEYWMPINWILILFMTLLFMAAVVIQLGFLELV